MSPPLRLADAADAPALAALYARTRERHLAFLPPLDKADLLRWMRDELLPRATTWVSVLDGLPVGYFTVEVLAREPAEAPAWIEHLYVAADRVGQGIGTALLAAALARCEGRAVRLYTFQANTGARRFYERHGFRPIAFGDGRDNMERCPDVLYERPAP